MTEIVAVGAWYLALQFFSLAVLPLTVRVFDPLPDRGFAISKLLGVLIVSGSIWLTGMLGFIQFSRASVVVVLSTMAGLAWWRWGACARRCLVGYRSWLGGELLFSAAFLAAVMVRSYTPDIVGQEKFMDFAIMKSFLTHQALPAPDPWLAGYGMPYYHFLYFTHALIAKLAGTPGPIAYNLAVATVFALTFVGAYSLIMNIARLAHPGQRVIAESAGIIGGLFLSVIGNLEAVLELLSIQNIGSAEFWSAIGLKGLKVGQPALGWLPADGGWWWRASRVIPTTKPDGINEFPFFSFLLGDLHPHYMALPLDLLAVALGVVVFVRPELMGSWAWRFISAIALGALIPANTWDVPVFWGLFGVCTVLAALRSRTLRAGLQSLVACYGIALILVLPYFVGYTSQPLGIDIVDERTPLPSFLVIFGAFVLSVAVWLVIPAPSLAREPQLPRWLVAFPIAGVLLCILAILLEARTLGLALLLGAFCAQRLVGAVWAKSEDPLPAMLEITAGLFLVLGFAIIAGTELLFIRDSFGTRMNTVFKFHYNAWLLLSLGSAVALASLIAQSRIRRIIASASILIVLITGGLYPIGATITKAGQLATPPTLDGSAFARRQYANDLAAIDWLQASVPSRAVIVEAVGGDYTDFARVSTFSGVPTPIGWVGHELQWRGPIDELTRRERLVQELYQTRDPESALRLMDVLQATHVFVGRLERDKYGPDVGERLRLWLPVIQQRGDTLILQRQLAAAR
ncbi:MAG: DUF2298 domain-containing protein [Chloroflexota bacterium]